MAGSTAGVESIRRSFEGMGRTGRAISGLGTVAVVAALLAFLVAPRFTAFPLVAFGVVVVYGWAADQAATAKFLTFLMTVSTILILGLITLYLVAKSIPAFKLMGPDILFRTEEPMWSASSESPVYSLVPAVWGTLMTTFIATLIAAPLGVAGALFISELAPGWAREILKPSVETLAGIPSVVYGLIGYTLLNDYLMNELALPTYGSLFAVGSVIGLMALPTVVSVAEDAISSVPSPMKSGSLALGATDWQTVKSVTLPASMSGISAAVLLGIGRAIGETMAATIIIGHAMELPDPIYDVFGNTETLTGLIASQYGNASSMQMSALFAAGVVLFVTVLVLSVVSQVIERRMEQKLGGNE
ncbi:phosphate ABC transporter permease subunit PstC [halophilic archaeon]|nr:phosphate ABC transporter permease subunit PstC [halophilic archaeon]